MEEALVPATTCPRCKKPLFTVEHVWDIDAQGDEYNEHFCMNPVGEHTKCEPFSSEEHEMIWAEYGEIMEMYCA